MDGLKRLHVDGGLELEYRLRRSGGASKGLVVLLHGVASNMTRWSQFVDETTLTRSLDVLRIDLRGHGRVPWRGRLDMEAWCDDLVHVLNHERCPRAYFIGHSLGAQIAVHFAHWHPDRAAGVVLIDPLLSRALLGHLRLASHFAFLLRAAIAVTRMLNRLGIHRRHIPYRDLRTLDEEMRKRLESEGRTRAIVRYYGSPLPDLKHFPTANFLQEIVQMIRPLPDLSGVTAPVLVVLSSGVTYTDPGATRERIDRFPHAETVTIDAYHWPLTEKPVEVRQAIESWFAALDTG
ncbi:MAG: alpha/beta hydrolase [Gammaproteobacteria bacterium]|nr:alpha/beta hydrolase [Gammaproteobacteria bacterium]